MRSSLRLLITCITFCIGSVIQLPITITSALFGSVCTLLLSAFSRRRYVQIFFTLTTGLLLGGANRKHWDILYAPSILPLTSTFSGLVVAPPDVRTDHTLLTVQPTGQKGYVLVHGPRYPVYEYGTLLRITGEQELAAIFSGFNYPLYLERYRIQSTIPQPHSISALPGTGGFRILSSLYAFRNILEERIALYIHEPEASFLGGILLGSNQTIPETIQEALRTTGTSHIIAISGANITILISLILQLFPTISLKRRLALVLSIAAGITLLTGSSASVVRGAVMSCMTVYLALFSRRSWSLNLLVYSMTIMLVFNPLLLAIDPGFQLSFAAFAGLAAFSRPLNKLPIFNPFPLPIRGSAIETTAATLGTFLVSCTLFGQASLLGLGVNPLILWLLPTITSLGLLLITAGWIPGIASLIFLPLWILLHLVLCIIQKAARIPFGLIHWHPQPIASGISWGIILLFLWPFSKKHHAST
jgi:competence protein ComEC